MVLPEVNEVEDIRMPGLNVYSEGAGPLVASLVDITSCSVVCSMHRYNTIGVAVGAGNVRPDCRVNRTIKKQGKDSPTQWLGYSGYSGQYRQPSC